MSSCCSFCSCCCEKDIRIKAAFIIILFYCNTNFILSIFQICNKEKFGYDDEEGNESKIIFAKTKTILNILYNLYVIIFGIQRFKNLIKGCKLGICFSFILLFGNIIVFIFTWLALKFYHKYDSNNFPLDCWISGIDTFICSFYILSVPPTLYLFFDLLSLDCPSNIFIEKELFWTCSSIYECIGVCCNLCNIFIKSWEECCKRCCANDLPKLKQANKRLKHERKNLKKI